MTDTISRAAALAVISDVGLRHGITGMPLSFVAAADAIRALPAVAASQPADPAVKADSCQRVTVKPLVWHEGDEPNEWKSGPYDVWCELGKFQLYYWSIVMGEPHETAEAAKAAAQADYERRILAAIETQPDPRDAVIAQLVEALEKSREGWANAIELGIIHKNHVTSAGILHDEAAAALAAAKGNAA